MPPRDRVITLTTDFGLHDSYVAEMKAVLLAGSPTVRIVDVTHEVPPQDVLYGSIVLERLVRVFPVGTGHIGVVDPGVGTDRRILLAKARGQLIICPDNGLITWTARCHALQSCHEVPRPSGDGSATFAGRDLIAPFAARLVRAKVSKRSIPKVTDPVLLDVRPAAKLSEAEIIYIDRFGNAVTNVRSNLLASGAKITVGEHHLPLQRTYADAKVNQPVALIGSSHLLEIAVRNGSAAKKLKLKVGDRLHISEP